MVQHNRARIFLFTSMLALGSAAWGPKNKNKKPQVTEEQLEYSKKMFAEGEAAMAAEQYADALAKFQEGYRYAPHLHVFTYNIASAADAAGDCQTAATYFRLFVDLVPKHPKRKSSKARLAQLDQECTDAPELASTTPGSDEPPPDRSEREKARAKKEAIAAMNAAYSELRSAQQLHEAAKKRFPDAPFAGPARRKRRHAKKVLKLAQKLGVPMELNDFDTLEVGGNAKSACKIAERQEKKVVNAIDAAMEHYDSTKAYRTFNRARRSAERDGAGFDACS